MAESDTLTLGLPDGFHLTAAGMRREKNGDLTADLMLVNGKVLHADRATINTPEGRQEWAIRATAQGRPSAERLEEVIVEHLLPEALTRLQEEEPRRPSQSDALVQMVVSDQDNQNDQDYPGNPTRETAAGVELFHDANGDAFATLPVDGHRETWPIKSRHFRQWLARRFYEQDGKIPKAQSLVDAINVIAGQAVIDGAEYPVHIRIAQVGETIYLDLCNPQWQAVAITADGWTIVDNPPVKFRRTRGMLSLPYPAAGGSINRLRPFVNAPADGDDNAVAPEWILIVAWLVGAFSPRGPYPVLIFHGEQGSAKSTTTRVLRSLVDPNTAAIRTMPRDERDLMIAATNSWAPAFDNISHLPHWLSDAFCRLATGGALATRTLYENDEETIFDAQRPIILNGIEEIATRGDLLDRSLLIYLPTIPEEGRKTEAAFWADFEAERPRILGALIDAVSVAIRMLPTTKLEKLPRMADFALWVTAAESALGWQAGTFIAAHTGNRTAANDLTLEASAVAQELRKFMEPRETYEGTATELYNLLTEQADDRTKWQKSWPGDGRSLKGALRRVAPNLRAVGIDLDFDHKKHGGKKLIRIHRAGKSSTPSTPSTPQSGLARQDRMFDGDGEEEGGDDSDDW